MVHDSVRLPISSVERASPSTSAAAPDISSLKSFESADAALIAKDLRKGRRLRGVWFTVADGETLVVLGPSGAGKTSLLRVVAGLESADGGSLFLDGRNMIAVAPQRRRVAVVFHDDALFPHMSIYQNLAFAMRVRRLPAATIDQRTRAVARALEIEVHLRHRPAQLSAGERQRAALARAVLSDPRVLLLDEPLAHLDPQLRVHVRAQFMEFRRSFSGAAIHVTHDHAEALSVGSRLAVMMDGCIVQIGDPWAVYDSPATTQVARFFGSPPMNLLDGEAHIAGIRAEHLRIDAAASLRGRVISRESTGADTFAKVRTPRGLLVIRVPNAQPAPGIGEEVGIALDPRFVRRFDRTSGVLLA